MTVDEHDGHYTSWWNNGVKKEEGTYREGRKIGRWVWYKITERSGQRMILSPDIFPHLRVSA